jgi:hypothetical protein
MENMKKFFVHQSTTFDLVWESIVARFTLTSRIFVSDYFFLFFSFLKKVFSVNALIAHFQHIKSILSQLHTTA